MNISFKYFFMLPVLIAIGSCAGDGDVEGISSSRVNFNELYTLDPIEIKVGLDQFDEFKQKVAEYGPIHHQDRVDDRDTLDNAYSEVADGNIYYDAGFGYYQAFYKLALPNFDDYAVFAQSLYQDILTNTLSTPYNISGRRNFNAGFFMRWLVSSDSNSLAAISGLREEAVPGDYFIDGRYSFYQSQHEGNVREVAYKLQNLILYEMSGSVIDQADALSNNLRINVAKDLLIAHANALTSFQYSAPEDNVSSHPTAQISNYPDWKFTQVFMMGLLADALIDYVDWVQVRRSSLETSGYIGNEIDNEHVQTYAEALAEIKPVILSIGEVLFDKHITIARVRIDGAVSLSAGDEVRISYNGTNYRRIVTAAETSDQLLADKFDDYSYLHITQPVIVDQADLASPTITATVVGGVNDGASLPVEIEDVDDIDNPGGPSRGKLWIADLGGSSGAWNAAGGSGFGAFRYAVPNYYSPLGSGYVGIPAQGGSGGSKHEIASPDLNMLTLPVMGFLYREGHPGVAGQTWRELGDAVFAGGVQAAAWDRAKAYNQQLKNTFKYLTWRQLEPATW